MSEASLRSAAIYVVGIICGMALLGGGIGWLAPPCPECPECLAPRAPE